MDFSKYTNRIASARSENRWLRWAVAGLLVSNVILAVGVLSKRAVVTIQPPGLTEAVQITQNEANAAYKKAWGLFVANLLGNVKPGSAEFIVAALTPLLASDLYRPMIDSIQSQAQQMAHARVATAFTAREVLYDPKTNTVYVAGHQTSTGPGADPVTRKRTYQMVIAIDNYKPLITALDVYADAPHLKEKR